MKKIENYQITLLLGLVLLFNCCQIDDLDNDKSNSKKAESFGINNVEHINYKSINSFSIKQKIESFNSELTKSYSSANHRGTLDEIIIDTTSVVLIQTENGYASYTFNVLNGESNNSLDNIVISHYPNDSIQAVLVKHHLNNPTQETDLNNLGDLISHSTYEVLDDTIDIIESRNSEYSCITVTVTIMVDKCRGENQGADECNDENGQPIQVPYTMIIAEACGFSTSGGGSGTNNGSEPWDPGSNSNSTGGTVDVSELPDDFIITTPKINVVNILKQTFELSDFDQNDIALTNFMSANYSSFDIQGFENITKKAYFYLLNNSFSDTSINFMHDSLIAMMNDASLSYDDIMNIRLSELYDPIVEIGDSYSYDTSINGENAMDFDSVEDFIDFKSNVEFELNLNNESLLGGGYSTRFKANMDGAASLNISVIQKLKDDSINQDYEIIDVITDFSGFIFGYTWEQTSTSDDYVVSGNIAIVNVIGLQHYNLFLEGIGTVYSAYKHFELKINIETGEAISITQIED